MPGTVYTIGHSTRSIDDFVSTLCAAGVTRLVDIRSLPGSRRMPQFDAEALSRALRSVGIEYVYLAALGGRRKKTPSVAEATNAAWRVRAFHSYADYALTAPFRDGLRALLRLAKQPCAIMCAEAVWWRCHRRIVTDYLLARGVRVVHLFDDAHAEEATSTPFSRTRKNGDVVYPATPCT